MGFGWHPIYEMEHISAYKSHVPVTTKQYFLYGYESESIPINTIFKGMNIHLPAIFMFTRGTRFWPIAILVVKQGFWQNPYVPCSKHGMCQG